MLAAGLDVGSARTKVVLWKDGGVLGRAVVVQGSESVPATVARVLDEVFATKDRPAVGQTPGRARRPVGTYPRCLRGRPRPPGSGQPVPDRCGHPLHGPIKVVVSPMQFDDAPFEARAAAPELGQHTEEVLLELGYTWTDIGRLKEERVII